MFAVEYDFAAALHRDLDQIADRFDILFQRRAEGDAHVIVPGLGDESDDLGIGFEQRGDARIVGGGTAGALGHAESGEPRLERRRAAEEFGIDRIGAGIAAFDHVDAEFVEKRRDQPLVFEREIDAGGLGAVAQRRIE